MFCYTSGAWWYFSPWEIFYIRRSGASYPLDAFAILISAAALDVETAAVLFLTLPSLVLASFFTSSPPYKSTVTAFILTLPVLVMNYFFTSYPPSKVTVAALLLEFPALVLDTILTCLPTIFLSSVIRNTSVASSRLPNSLYLDE